VGGYDITQGTLGNPNYIITVNNGTLTITPAALTVNADNQSRTYGAANPTLTYTASGLVNSDTLSGDLATTATVTSNVGGYDITQGTLGNPNYIITVNNGTLTISPAALTVTAADRTKTYGETVTFVGTEFTSTGLQNGETIGSVTLTSAGAAASASVAGSPYAIAPSAATGGTFTAGNYTITYLDGVMTVFPVVPTPSGDNYSMTLDGLKYVEDEPDEEGSEEDSEDRSEYGTTVLPVYVIDGGINSDLSKPGPE
jgi:hypothetical protein